MKACEVLQVEEVCAGTAVLDVVLVQVQLRAEATACRCMTPVAKVCACVLGGGKAGDLV